MRLPGIAAVCKSGHVLAWSVAIPMHVGMQIADYCAGCGERIITQCPNCKKDLPGDTSLNLTGMPYYLYCMECGKPYPWRAKQVKDAKHTIALRADIDDWDAASKKLANEIIDDIAKNRANPSRVIAGMEWLAKLGFAAGKDVLWESVKSFGSDALKAAVKAHFNIP